MDLHRRPPCRHRVRPRAGATYRRCHRRMVEGGARRQDLRRRQPELPRPHHRVRLQPASEGGRTGVDSRHLGRAGRSGRPERVQPPHRAGAPRVRRRRPRRHRRRTPLTRAVAGVVEARPRQRPHRHAVPTGVPEDAGRAETSSAEPFSQ